MISYKVNNLFNDFGKLERAIGAELARRLRTVGGQLRTRLKRQVRRRKGPSQPGQSPNAHAPGNSGFRRVEFRLESDYRMVVGAIKYGQQGQDRPAPNANEEGGRVVSRNTASVPVQLIRRGRKLKPSIRGKIIQTNLPAGIVEGQNGLLRNSSTGRYLTKGQALAVRKTVLARAKQQSRLIGRIRYYPKRPTARPVLARAIRDRVIPNEFKNLVNGF